MKHKTSWLLYPGIILILICLFVFINALQKRVRNRGEENYENRFKKDIQVVVARYKEDLQFLKNGEFDGFHVIIYNKGKPITDPALQKYKIVNLPNVGKIDHTILYHIIHTYDNLHDTTLFIPGSVLTAENKVKQLDKIIKTLNENPENKSALLSHSTNGPVQDVLYDFTMKQYTSGYGPNRNPEVDNEMLPSPIQPFGEWHRALFGDNKTDQIFFYGVFAVSKEQILKNPRSKYNEIISFIDSHPNPEAGHYIERSWTSLFL